MARDARRVLALEGEAQAVGGALLVLQAQQLTRELLLPRGAGARLALALRDRLQLRLQVAALLRQPEERTVRLANRLAALAQLVGGLAARLLRGGEVRLQLLDARAKLAQLLLARRGGPGARGVLRRGVRGRGERQQRGGEGQAQGYFAFPCETTACIALATASGSPR